jgi:hypothetical protein
MELDIHLNEKNHPQIPHESDKVETEKHHKEEHLPFWLACKAHENELSYCGEVILGHGFDVDCWLEDENKVKKSILDMKDRIFFSVVEVKFVILGLFIELFSQKS